MKMKKEAKKLDIKNKKLWIIIASVVGIIVLICIFIEIKYKSFTYCINAFKERHTFGIMLASDIKYIDVGEEVEVNTITKLFQKKVKNLEVASSDEKIVSTNGNIVKGEKVGKVILQGKENARESYTIAVECIVKPKEIKLEKDEYEISVGYPLKINAEVFPENATYKELNYISSNEQIAVVEDGKIIGRKEGECIITITDKTELTKKDVKVIVEYIPVEKIEIDETSIEVGVGNKYILSSKLYPEFASNLELEWSSKNEKIATVKNGIVVAKRIGETQIEVSSEDGKKSTCNIKVVENEPERVKRYLKGEKPLRISPIDNARELISYKRNTNIEILKEYDEWCKVRAENGSVGYVQKSQCTKDKSYYIKKVPFIDQYELGYPTGCEAVSATMVAKFKGYNIEAYQIINNTPTDDRGVWTENIKEEIKNKLEGSIGENKKPVNEEQTEYVEKEVKYGGDPFKVFVGHPSKNYEQGSYGCYAKPIVEALEKCNIDCREISGCTEKELLKNIEKGNPVVVWGTFDSNPVRELEEWRFPDGEEGEYLHLEGEHCMVLIGYDDDNIYLNDPIAGQDVSQTKEAFFRNWHDLFDQAIVIDEK